MGEQLYKDIIPPVDATRLSSLQLCELSGTSCMMDG